MNALRNELDAEYALQRERNIEALERRRQHALSVCPGIAELQAAIQAAFGQMARGAIAAPGEAKARIERARREIASFNARLARLLQEANLPVDYLEPSFRCAACRDTGYVGDPLRERCACYAQRQMERLFSLSNLDPDSTQTFDSFSLEVFPDSSVAGGASQRERMRYNRDQCLSFAQRFPDTRVNNMILYGHCGLGKTFLLNCIAQRVLERGHTALKVTSYRLLETMRKYHMGMPDQELEMDLLLSAELLLIDDLGTEPLLENISLEHLFTILNERACAHRHTVVATNLTLTELQKRYTERISSRLFDRQRSRMIHFEGQDIRLYARPDRVHNRGSDEGVQPNADAPARETAQTI